MTDMDFSKAPFAKSIDSSLLLDSKSTAPLYNTYNATAISLIDGVTQTTGVAAAETLDRVLTLMIKASPWTDAANKWDLLVEYSDDLFATTPLKFITYELKKPNTLTEWALAFRFSSLAARVRLKYLKTGAPGDLLIHKGYIAGSP